MIFLDFQRLFEVLKSLEKREMVHKISENVSVILSILIYPTHIESSPQNKYTRAYINLHASLAYPMNYQVNHHFRFSWQYTCQGLWFKWLTNSHTYLTLLVRRIISSSTVSKLHKCDNGMIWNETLLVTRPSVVVRANFGIFYDAHVSHMWHTCESHTCASMTDKPEYTESHSTFGPDW